MHRNSGLPVVSLLLIASSYFLRDPDVAIAAPESRALAGAYLGFDLNTYPATPPFPSCAKHSLSPATGSALHQEPSETPGSANASFCSRRNLVFSSSIAARKPAN